MHGVCTIWQEMYGNGAMTDLSAIHRRASLTQWARQVPRVCIVAVDGIIYLHMLVLPTVGAGIRATDLATLDFAWSGLYRSCRKAEETRQTV